MCKRDCDMCSQKLLWVNGSFELDSYYSGRFEVQRFNEVLTYLNSVDLFDESKPKSSKGTV